MASKGKNNEIENNSVIQAFKSEINDLKLERKKLSDENQSLRVKIADDGKKLLLIRQWITNFNGLSDDLKKIVKDWDDVTPVKRENKENAPDSVAKSIVHQRPIDGLRIVLNRDTLISKLDRLQQNVLIDGLAKAAQAPGPSSSSGSDAVLDAKVKTEIADEEAKKIVASVDPISMKSSTKSDALVETPKAKKRKIPELTMVRQTRSNSKANNDEGPSVKRILNVTPVPVLNKGGDDESPTVSRSKSDGGKSFTRLMKKRSTNN